MKISELKIGQLIDVWVVYENEGERSIGNPSKTLVFTTELAAQAAALNSGWFGGRAHVGKFQAIKAADKSLYLITQPIHALDDDSLSEELIIRQEALAKLSDKEKKALGL